MKIKTTRFGELDIPKECIVKFEQGMLGFTQQKKFALFPYDTDGPFFLLQAVNDPHLTFLLTDPYRFFTEYEFELEDKLAANMEFAADNPPGGYVVATTMLKINPMEYVNATLQMVPYKHVFIGLTYGTVFGVIIAMTGCFQGMRCGRSAQAVGQATTTAVVHAIVGIIVSTAIITVICNVMDI